MLRDVPMGNVRALILIAIAMFASVLTSADAAEEDLQRYINEAVMPKIGCRVRVDGRDLEPMSDNLPMYVIGVEDKRLSVAAFEGDEQTVAVDQVVRVDEAVAYYTGLIKKNSNDAWSYEMRLSPRCSARATVPAPPQKKEFLPIKPARSNSAAAVRRTTPIAPGRIVEWASVPKRSRILIGPSPSTARIRWPKYRGPTS
ncbi:MAG: hypothetical protein QM775_14785 [Pirellulales bacterium]